MQIIQDMEGNLLYVGSASVAEGLGEYYKILKKVKITDIYRKEGSLSIHQAIWELHIKGSESNEAMRQEGEPIIIQFPLEDRVSSGLKELIE